MRDEIEDTTNTERAIAVFASMRRQKPLVQCITNFVAMNPAANAVLAAGASPAMIHCAEESGDFARVAGGLTVNMGTLSPAWVAGMFAAIAAAKDADTPWVLDPVAHFATPYRARVGLELLEQNPTILRGNASEILAFGGAASAGRGVDSGDAVASAMDVARDIARRTGGVVAVTGEQDFLTDGYRGAWVRGGSPLMEQVTAIGCSLTAVMGGFVAVAEDPFDAALAALLLFAVAGEAAGKKATGPGSFSVAFFDALAATQPGDLGAERVHTV